MDNIFTSIPLVEDLLGKKRTIVRTLRKNKEEVPSELTEAREIHGTTFAATNRCQMKRHAECWRATIKDDNLTALDQENMYHESMQSTEPILKLIGADPGERDRPIDTRSIGNTAFSVHTTNVSSSFAGFGTLIDIEKNPVSKMLIFVYLAIHRHKAKNS
ncbi:hypothetical protein T10_9796 [Trichinella papuae]|uniref:PiggyBac transposable element-derived protein domain-containing protein n=1 Tax=Trichinella papuae TaxID=268474 RepID=A0A0V1M761_9BILA|nr:hypothetical protein T10_9796 [Trichinella papuae]